MKQLSNAAIDVLSGSLEVIGPHVRIARPLDRKLYVEVNDALAALGGKWNGKAKAHVFANDPSDAIADVVVDGGFHDKKRDLQQFFTPPALATMVVDALGLLAGCTVLEPSAGRGALAGERAARGVAHGDFLDESIAGSGALYHAIAMNPPFTKGQDVAHVTRAFGLLAPGGKLAAIMSGGVEFRSDGRTKNFRELIERAGGDIERLPDDSFKESGTSVRTVLVTMTKR